jgi:protein-S-isoprenylcysteine O-methyltransferase Ste14
MMHSRLIRYRPPGIAQTLVLIAALLTWVLPLGTNMYSNLILGGLALAAGLAIMLAAWWQFRRRRTAICPTNTPSVLITNGTYRFTRNPMYLGMFVILLGIAIIVGSLPFYVAAGLFVLIIHHAFCPYEEARLREIFGADFENYCRRVRRWL